MSDLLTAKDVEIKVFKKVRWGGYSVPEVEDFLNQVADDLEAYALQIEEKDNRLQELEALIKKQESMKDSIKDTLILARQTAQDVENQAKANAEKIIAEAHVEAEKIISEADGKVQGRINEAENKASEILTRARNSADEILKSSQDKRAQAEQSRASIEHELEAQRREAKEKSDGILAEARNEASRLLYNAQNDIENYRKEIKTLCFQKQQFVKNTVSLLLDFGKIIDRAQQDIDEESQYLPPENDSNSDGLNNMNLKKDVNEQN